MAVPYPVPFPECAPQDCEPITITFGSDYLPVILRQLLELHDIAHWDSPPSDYQAQIDELILQFMTEDAPPVTPIYPTSVQATLAVAKDYTTGGIAFIADSAQMLAGYWRGADHANGDGIKLTVLLAKGIYTLHIVGISANNQGKQAWDINQVVSTTLDWYSSTTVRNVHQYITGLHVNDDGEQEIHMTVNGKNASSSNYYYSVSLIWLEKTGDV